MAELFNEVDAQLRSARFADVARRVWPYVAGVVLLVVLVCAGFWAWRTQALAREEKASITYAAGLAAVQSGKPNIAQAAFDEVAHDAPAGYRSLALMQAAALSLQSHRNVEAVRRLDEAAKVAPDRVIGDAAALKAAYITLDSATMSQTQARLKPLTDTARPYRALAREALAFAELANGQMAQARSDLTVLSLQQDVSDAARARARAALAMVQSGRAASIAAIVKAQLAQPVSPPPVAGAPR